MKRRARKGFTLVELLLYIFVAGAMLMAVSGALIFTLEVGERGKSIAEVEQQGRFSIATISQAIRNADSVSVPANGSSATTITLQVSDAAKNPTVIDISGGVIRIKEGAGSQISLTSSSVNVDNLDFTNLALPASPGSIRIQMGMSINGASGRHEYDYTKTFYATANTRP